MSPVRIYLDHNATTPMRPQALAALVATSGLVGNPSSVHAEGRQARSAVETAREQVAALVGAKMREIAFTSGGTEANNTVLRGGWDTIVAAGVEHDSVLGPLGACGIRKIVLPVDAGGIADLTALDQILVREASALRRILVSLQMANNETGVLQPVDEAARIARRHGACFHTDAVQATGKVSVDFSALGVDFMTISAHKIGGPKGIGALVVRDGLQLSPLVTGGGQEYGARAGTENVAGIAAFGAAAIATADDLASLPSRLRDYQHHLEQSLLRMTPHVRIVAPGVARLANTTCIAVPGASAETLVIALDLAGIAVSAGAACTSGKVRASHVLTAMGLPIDIAGSSIRISTGWSTTRNDIDAFLGAFEAIVEKAQNTSRARRVA